ncbi:MAG: NAD-dependent epimerase/dehydratase family protein [Bdellovibrionales bacterium]
MTYLVTGGAGFIGSHLVDSLLARGNSVRVIDNLSTGDLEHLGAARAHPKFEFINKDIYEQGEACMPHFEGVGGVIHMAANADVRFGTERPRRDLEQNTIATWNVLEAMRRNGVKEIAFASTGSIYGEPEVFPTPEDAPFPTQTSLYGASKLAAEGMISAYCHGFDMRGFIFRFVSCLGPRYTHGHVIDFVRQLRRHPEYLDVLGDGYQRKSYMHVSDCVNGVLLGMDRATERVNVFNLGVDGSCTVRDSIGWICEEMGLRPELRFSGGKRGWIGDSPHIHLDIEKITKLGHLPQHTIPESVKDTVRYLLAHERLLA